MPRAEGRPAACAYGSQRAEAKRLVRVEAAAPPDRAKRDLASGPVFRGPLAGFCPIDRTQHADITSDLGVGGIDVAWMIFNDVTVFRPHPTGLSESVAQQEPALIGTSRRAPCPAIRGRFVILPDAPLKVAALGTNEHGRPWAPSP